MSIQVQTMADDSLVHSVAGLVLAVGISQRFGSDKRQASVSGETKLLPASLAVPCAVLSEVFVVLRADNDPDRLNLPAKVQRVHSKQSALGMGHNLASGIQWLLEHSQADAIAVFLGDMSWLRETRLRHLLTEAGETQIVLPFFFGKHGHPVIFGRKFWPELHQLQGDSGWREIIRRHTQSLQIVELDDIGLVCDVDTPRALINVTVGSIGC